MLPSSATSPAQISICCIRPLVQQQYRLFYGTLVPSSRWQKRDVASTSNSWPKEENEITEKETPETSGDLPSAQIME